MSFLTFIVILSILVIVHEWGHYISAKSVGVKVEKFSVGFGPKLFSKMHDGTEFMVCAIPLGGYVKMAGDERASCKGNKEEFFSHPVGHRAFVVVMGPIINFVFAYLCFYLIFVIGYPMLAPKVGKVMEGYPAQMAGLEEGDEILQIDSQGIDSWENLQTYVTHSQSGSLTIKLRRSGEEVVKEIVPRRETMTNIFGQKETVSLIGIQPKEEVIFLKYGILESFGKAGQQLWNVTWMTYKSLYHVVTGGIPAKDALAGPIRIFDVIRSASHLGFSYLVYVMAIISASLAIFNLFPIPVLDGGHLFLMAIEKIRRRPISLKLEENLTKVGFTLLMCLMVFVVYNDIIQMGWIESLKNFVGKLKQ
ncbi:MAG: RIP metalloprotease RseP [Candidatus Omnitrophica bacterium]|nr:RIP metalloprotease RseP [Candidatus Omnitrophota bacterium]